MKKNQMYPTDLTDGQWDCIKDLIEGGKARRSPTNLGHAKRHKRDSLPRSNDRANGECFHMSIQCGKACTPNARQWRDDGTWQRIHDTLRAQVRKIAGRHKHPTAGAMDSQSVKTTQVGGTRGYDSGKHVKGRKRHILVDTLGLLLTVVVTSAALSNPAGARLLLASMKGFSKKLRKIWVDGTYRSLLLEWVLEHFKFVLQPILRLDDQKGFVVLPRRWVVERTFAWITQCRLLCLDYEALARSS